MNFITVYSDDYNFNNVNDEDIKKYNNDLNDIIKQHYNDCLYYKEKQKQLYNYLVDSRRLEIIGG